MYLNRLNRTEKSLFIALAKGLCSADGVFSEDEQIMFRSYYKEMEVSPQDLDEMDVTEALKGLAHIGDEWVKRIFIFELLGLAYVDKGYTGEEVVFIDLIVETFGLSQVYVDEIEDLIKRYIWVQNRMNDLVLGDE